MDNEPTESCVCDSATPICALSPRRKVGLFRRVGMWPIYFYRVAFSWLMGGQCRFTPSCSQYALEAIEAHGVFRGWALASWRLLRCQPFCKGGHDPVPPIKSGKFL